MASYPTFVERAAQPYAFIRYTVTMDEMTKPADEGFSKLFGWLGAHGIAPVGAPFFSYRRIDMATTLDVEAGIPVESVGTDDGDIRFGTLPAGRYVNLTHTGHYDKLMDVTGMLIGWAKERGIRWDVVEKPDGDHFACRLEIYETDPTETKDPADWVTELVFKLADTETAGA